MRFAFVCENTIRVGSRREMRRDYRKIAIQNYTVRIRLKLGIQISGKAEKFYRRELKFFFPLPGRMALVCAYKAL